MDDLLEAMYSGDFSSSTRILSKLQADQGFFEVSLALKNNSKLKRRKPLVIRDHIFKYFQAFPIYTALYVSSFDLLELLTETDSRVEACQSLVKMTKEMVANKDPRLHPQFIEVQDLANNEFMALIVDILERRKVEMQRIDVPFSKVAISGITRSRYIMASLASTAYGKRLLDSLGLENVPIVTEKEWRTISHALEDLGIDTSYIVREIDEDEWQRRTFGISREQETPSKELLDLKFLRLAWPKIMSLDASVREKGLEQYQDLCTIYGLERIFSLAKNGTRKERALAINILGNIGSEKYEPYFEKTLSDEDPLIRKAAANAISKLGARNFLRDSPYVVKSTLSSTDIDDSDIEISDLHPKNRYERLDVAKLYLGLESKEAAEKLIQLFRRLDLVEKKEILSFAFDFKKDQVEVLIRQALLDGDNSIREAAASIGRILWPGSHWDINLVTSEPEE